MRILLIGATGMVGSRVATEALAHGHEVVGVTRSGNAGDLIADPKFTIVAGDANDPKIIAEFAADLDAVVSAVSPPRDGSPPIGPFLAVASAIIDGTREAGLSRLVWVGGAGSLKDPSGTRMVDTPGFPEMYRPEALAQDEVLSVFQGIEDLDWTYVSPAAEIGPGERTGTFRTGHDDLLVDADGNSRISAEDYAIAIVDTLENGDHLRERITVGY